MVRTTFSASLRRAVVEAMPRFVLLTTGVRRVFPSSSWRKGSRNAIVGVVGRANMKGRFDVAGHLRLVGLVSGGGGPGNL